MINRLKEYFAEPEERPPAEEYFVVGTRSDEHYVARDTGERLLRQLAPRFPSCWTRFTDLHGSHICVRTGLIEYVRELTGAQRAMARRFRRARREEEKADRRRWDDDDWF
ncbi:MAG: hypothetical protein HY703_13880 [Gemmatimonadetes bacterium]|nr:hypothetical protein [Gemmatimonadota bacterium]